MAQSRVVEEVAAEHAPQEPVAERAPQAPVADLESPLLYLNRELTWLAFNRRVLAEAQDARNPLLERVKFLAITASNLDEFFMKRIGGLKQQVAAGFQQLTVDGRTPLQQIAECYAIIREMEQEQRDLLRELVGLLRGHDLNLATWDSLSTTDQRSLRERYFKNVF